MSNAEVGRLRGAWAVAGDTRQVGHRRRPTDVRSWCRGLLPRHRGRPTSNQRRQPSRPTRQMPGSTSVRRRREARCGAITFKGGIRHLAQNVMFSAVPPSWARFAPGYGAVRVLVDGAFTADFDETRGLLLALAWFAAITVAALLVFHRLARPRTG